jgi:valyl-tRNA synthetase
MNTEDQDCGAKGGAMEFSIADRWITSRLQRSIANVNDAIGNYRFDLAAQAIYEFTWNEYCDWYLELSKPVLQSAESSIAAQRGTRHTLVSVLESLLRLTHPIMPFITEEIWQRVAPLAGVHGETIMHQPYPQADASRSDAFIETEMDWLMRFILGVRNIRGEMNISPGKPLPVLLQNGSTEDSARLERYTLFLRTLARLESITWLEGAEATESATALVGDMKLLIPMAGLIDKDAELARLSREIEKLGKDLDKCQTKLANPSYVERAPAEVVAQERARVAELQSALNRLEEQAARIRAL